MPACTVRSAMPIAKAAPTPTDLFPAESPPGVLSVSEAPLFSVPAPAVAALFFSARPFSSAEELAVVYIFCAASAVIIMSPLIFISSPSVNAVLSAMIALVVPFTTEMAADPATPTLEAPTPETVWVEIKCPTPSSSSLLPNKMATAFISMTMISLRCSLSLTLSKISLRVPESFLTMSTRTLTSVRPSAI